VLSEISDGIRRGVVGVEHAKTGMKEKESLLKILQGSKKKGATGK